jgi:hypothetical protein
MADQEQQAQQEGAQDVQEKKACWIRLLMKGVWPVKKPKSICQGSDQ